MKIVHVSSSDTGGAGIAAVRLNKALNSIGVDSKLLCLHKSMSHENVEKYEVPIVSKLIRHSHLPYLQNKYLNRISEFDSHYEASSFPEALYDMSSSPIIHEADVINLHWVGSTLNYRKFFRNVKKPIIWTLHDMNPFLGIAHYTGDLISNKVQFGEIEDRVRAIKKRGVNDARHLEIVCLCEWMKRYSEKSEMFGGLKHHIVNNSIDVQIFNHRDKLSCRNILGLPLDKKIMLFCAQAVSNARKGFDILLESLSKINTDIFICIIGNIKGISLPQKLTYKCFGTLKDELLLSIIYSSADLFVLPSREDNLPNTMLESLCSGTPVISFRNGGMVDVIQNGVSGLLVESPNANALAKGIDSFFDSMHSYDPTIISSEARQRFSPERQAKKYLDIYKKAMSW